MRTNTALTRLQNGKSAIGSWLQLGSEAAARMLAAQGCFDWLLVDLEHSPIGYETAARITAAVSDVSGGTCTPLIRPESAGRGAIAHALDAGAQGIVVPMVETAQDAEQVVRYACFPPVGERGSGGLAAHLAHGTNRPTYIAGANRQTLVGIQVETTLGVKNIDEILQVPGIDLVFIGPNDLHLSLGLPARFWSDDPLFLDAVERVTDACHQRDMPVGTLCRDARAAALRLDDDFRFIGMGSDAHFMLTHAGLQYGELTATPEPEETWCNLVRMPEPAPVAAGD